MSLSANCLIIKKQCSPDLILKKNEILKKTAKLLKQNNGANMTMRAIAAECEVGLGLLNYYFGSKDKLLAEAGQFLIREKITSWKDDLKDMEIPAETRLINFLTDFSSQIRSSPEMTRTRIKNELFQDEITTPEFLVPILEEIFKDKKQHEIRLASLQITIILELIFTRPDAFLKYLGYSKVDKETYREIIESIVDNLISH